jgi:hypothetical protein
MYKGNDFQFSYFCPEKNYGTEILEFYFLSNNQVDFTILYDVSCVLFFYLYYDFAAFSFTNKMNQKKVY